MRVAHFAIATPGRCGLYETTREIVLAERNLGIDARIVDPKPNLRFHPGNQDRGVPIEKQDWARKADIFVSHSGHDGTVADKTDQPIVIAAHGRPISTFMMEREGGAPAYSYHIARSRLPRYRACVTFWDEYVPYFQAMWGDKPVHHVPATVDIDYWSPGDTDYNFAGRRGGFNVVMTDPWARRDVSLLPMIHAFHLFRQAVPDARLHIYAMDANLKGLEAIKAMLGDSLGIIQGWAQDLRSVYRAADMLITPHRIYTRSIREALACGVEVVSGRDCHPENLRNFANEMLRRRKVPNPSRFVARTTFAPSLAGRAMKKLLEAV